MQVTIKGFIYANGMRHFNEETLKYVDGPKFEFSECGTLGGEKCFEEYVLVGPHVLIAKIPDSFDPRQQLAANLKAEKKRLQAEFNRRVTEIDRQIQTYLAIEA